MGDNSEQIVSNTLGPCQIVSVHVSTATGIVVLAALLPDGTVSEIVLDADAAEPTKEHKAGAS
jgi:hypothetical protein